MFRAVLTILFISNLLACPLRCTTCAAGVSSDADAVALTCECCPLERETDTSPDSQDQPCDDCSCGSCLCEGATLDAKPQLAAAASWIATVAHRVTATELLEARDTYRRCGNDATSESSPHSGRAALIALQHWQI
ncbi:hypothetical protein Fuma_03191 [Fuerstiella marisgermanici]|uniref:Uncharacterized protein n=1 Tax=Fuerstiella marisgermanici TaxID=1891926 RepID=A0A1P8WHR2_9PLAN|nr:hypothetical protein Fuma_03191 [Fuerstiella marisgermanici]